jgi:ABC-type Fe3+/spermidine/putrescine transport system ATPase subunit
MAVITFDKVSKSYRGRVALRDFTLELAPGERLVLLGPSGCGKTTVLRLLAGFIAPDSGEITVGGQAVATDGRILVEPEDRNLGMVFQDLALWPHMTVSGNLEFGMKMRGVPRRERRQRVLDTLRLVQMDDFTQARPAELSGGQQQRVALARALVQQPDALLMDEALSSLDTELNELLLREITRLHERLGFTLLYVTHSRHEALDIGTRLVLMREGVVKRIGPPEQFSREWHAACSSPKVNLQP